MARIEGIEGGLETGLRPNTPASAAVQPTPPCSKLVEPMVSRPVCAFVYVCVCVFVSERERERERKTESV